MHLQELNKIQRALAIPVGLALLLACGAPPAQAGGWFKAAVGMSGLTMDDINNETFSFFDYTGGFDFPNLKSGFSLSFHLGFDLSPDFALGFSWDHQYARVSGNDADVTADLNLDANFFMGHLYWSPLRTGRWSFGAAAGLGLAFPDGRVSISDANNVNFGQGDTTGNSTVPLEIMALVDFGLSKKSAIELTVGWRWAVIDEFKYQSHPVVKDDGTNIALDYTGYIIKGGWKYVFGSGQSGQPAGNIH